MRGDKSVTLPELGAIVPGPTPADELLTPEQAGALLQRKAETVRKLAQAGEFPSIRMGYRTVRFRRSDLEEFIARNRFVIRHADPAPDSPIDRRGDPEAALAAAVLELARAGTLGMRQRLEMIEALAESSLRKLGRPWPRRFAESPAEYTTEQP